MSEILISTTRDWREFVRDNRDALLEQFPSIEKAFLIFLSGHLQFGGGAAPLIKVKCGFVLCGEAA